MVKLHECVRECSFEKPDEVVKFLFLMHNQNPHVHEELLESMKDADGLNDILGYAVLLRVHNILSLCQKLIFIL